MRVVIRELEDVWGVVEVIEEVVVVTVLVVGRVVGVEVRSDTPIKGGGK